MFVGHYAASLALKRVEPKASLGWLFLAVQFVDILFFPLVSLGIERMSVIPHYTAATHFRLDYMPYTHSLVAAFLWSGVWYIAFRLLPMRKRVNTGRLALVMALAVFSHWVLDLVTHTPDLPLWFGSSPKVGFGLWRSALATYVVEAALLLVGLRLYLRATKARAKPGKYGMTAFVLLLLLVNVVNVFGPPMGSSQWSLAVSALVTYFLFAGIAFWLDRKRTGVGAEVE